MPLSNRFAYRALTRALAVEAGVPTTCRVCGDAYVPAEELHLVCTDCFLRLRRTLSFREMLLGIGLKALAARDATDA